MRQTLTIVLTLVKIRITMLVAITTAFGYYSFMGDTGSRMIIAIAGVFLLACGSAVINHLQEFRLDALMERTKGRPIPSGKISSEGALLFSLFLVLTGSALLFFAIDWVAFLLGLTAFVWYNGIYTPLKRRTAFAVIPGSVIGALPPVIGWHAAGGSLLDPQILVIALFFFVWQIPHFWLLLLLFSKDYQAAGLPTLNKLFNDDQIARLTFIWTTATAVLGVFFLFFDLIKSLPAQILIASAAMALIFYAFRLVRPGRERKMYRMVFNSINGFVLWMMLVTAFEKMYFVLLTP
ncbi:heme o synthase [uncultured bacterium]|nr:heme o synthase [uncultured bacterium]